MSLFVAIPSGLDTRKGFSRLNFWTQNSEWIYVSNFGRVEKISPTFTVATGLVLVSLSYFKQHSATKEARYLIEKADGVFIHPGGSDTPHFADAARAIEVVPDDFRYQILAKTVAFTRSGAGDYQVAQLTLIWNWMSGNSTEGEEHKIFGFDLDRIQIDFGTLRGKQGRDAITRVCLLAQGSIDPDMNEAIRKKLAEELQEFLTGEGLWLGNDSQLGTAVSPLIRGELTKKIVSDFLEKVRERFGKKTR